jgi:hypothetical protein
MMSNKLTRDQRRGARRTACDRQRWRVRPTLTALEDRRLMSTIIVNNPTDTPIVGQIDLRQAIAQANFNGGNETITFDKKVFKTPQTITLSGTQLELNDTTGTETITAPKAGVTISGGGFSRVFEVDSGATASFSGLTISDGTSPGAGGGVNVDGGTARFRGHHTQLLTGVKYGVARKRKRLAREFELSPDGPASGISSPQAPA